MQYPGTIFFCNQEQDAQYWWRWIYGSGTPPCSHSGMPVEVRQHLLDTGSYYGFNYHEPIPIISVALAGKRVQEPFSQRRPEAACQGRTRISNPSRGGQGFYQNRSSPASDHRRHSGDLTGANKRTSLSFYVAGNLRTTSSICISSFFEKPQCQVLSTSSRLMGESEQQQCELANYSLSCITTIITDIGFTSTDEIDVPNA